MKKMKFIVLVVAFFVAFANAALNVPIQASKNKGDVTFVTSDGKKVPVSIDTARLFKLTLDAGEGSEIPLPKITGAMLQQVLDDLKWMALKVYNYVNASTYGMREMSHAAALISQIPYEERKKSVERELASAFPVQIYSKQALKNSVDYLNAASYLDIPELIEKYIWEIASMLASDASLSLLCENKNEHLGVIRNQISPEIQSAIAKYIPQGMKVYLGRYLQSVKFSPDGSKVVTAATDNTAKIVDASTGALLHTIQHDAWVKSAEFSPDGSKIVTAVERGVVSHGMAKIVDVVTGRVLHTIEHFDKANYMDTVNSAKFSPDGTKVVTASNDETAKIVDVKTGQVLHTIQYNDPNKIAVVYSAEFSPDGSKVVTASNDNTVKIIDVNTGEVLHIIRYDEEVKSVKYSLDGSKVVSAGYKVVKIVDVATERVLHIIRDNDFVQSAEFSPDGTKIVMASITGTVKIIDVNTGAVVHTIQRDAWIRSAKFSPDGSKIVIASGTTVMIIDGRTGRELYTIQQDDQLDSAEFSPDGRNVVSGFGGTVQIDPIVPQARTLDQALLIRSLAWAQKHDKKIAWQTEWASKVMKTYSPAEQAQIKAIFSKKS